VQYDTFTVSSLLRGGNFDYATSSTIWQGNAPSGADKTTYLAQQSLPPSLFLQGAPQFFTTPWGTVPWPPIGPEVTGGPTATDPTGRVHDIPAKICFDQTPLSADGVTRAFNAVNCYAQ
jgi:hypothetical protein